MTTNHPLNLLVCVLWSWSHYAQASLPEATIELGKARQIARAQVALAEGMLKTQSEFTRNLWTQLHNSRNQIQASVSFSSLAATQHHLCQAQKQVLAKYAAYQQQYGITGWALTFNESASCVTPTNAPSSPVETATVAQNTKELEARFHAAQHESFLRLLDLQKAKLLNVRAEQDYLTARQNLDPERPIVLLSRQQGLEGIEIQLNAVIDAGIEGTSPLLLREVQKHLPEIRQLVATYCGTCETHDPIAVLVKLQEQVAAAFTAVK